MFSEPGPLTNLNQHLGGEIWAGRRRSRWEGSRVDGHTKLLLRFARLFAHGNLPQGAFSCSTSSGTSSGPEDSKPHKLINGQMHQVQTKAHFIECLLNHSTEIG
ncbi:MAG: hypothetical protein DMG58_25015 [Acidobacteria bacterium]|nr:MAG: hypothetical protein DMG58_25015 [Acidobacteriota bacterium]